MERKCANPRCWQFLSERVPPNINYCGYCLRKLRQLTAIFPDGDLENLVFLLHHGWANLVRVANLLGLNRRTVMGYRQKNLIPFQPRGKYAIVSLEELVKFALWRKRLINMSQAARIMRISYHTLKRLIALGIIKPDFRLPNRIRYFDKTRLRDKRRIIQEWQEQKKIRKIASAQTRKIKGALTTKEMAEILGMSLSGIWYQINQGRLAVFKRNGRVYAHQANFSQFCRLVTSNPGKAIGYTKQKAGNYLLTLSTVVD